MRRRHVTSRLLIALLSCGVIMSAALPAATAQPDEALLADDFDDPAVGLLAQTSQQPDRWSFSYEEGEYVIRKIDPDAGVIRALLPRSFTDAAITVDVRLTGETEGRYALATCRSSAAGSYRLSIDPYRGQMLLSRSDAGRVTTLINRSSPTIQRDTATNRITLRCAGSTIAAEINGTRVAVVDDATHLTGQIGIGVGSYSERPLDVEARFDNLVVTRLAAEPVRAVAATPTLVPPPATGTPPPAQAPPTPPGSRLLLADNFDDPGRGIISVESPDTMRVTFAYEGGEFVVRKVVPDAGRSIAKPLPGTFSDAVLTIDARLSDPTAGRFIIMWCRRGPTGGGYDAVVLPDTGRFSISRIDGVTETVLAMQRSPLVMGGTATNRLELRCVGDEIALRVNGVLVATVQDRTHSQGAMSFGVGNFEPAGPAEARFDNLVVTTAPAP